MAPGSNTLPFHGNEKTMNLNPLVLANIQASPYFKLQLYELKTYHQVIDEIYYKVNHLEPWEKGSRKIAGQTGMCGGVRGVGTGGIVSSAFCLLYKLYTLKLTHRQVVGLCTHSDSPFIRSLGLMYIRYTVPPDKLWPMFEPYVDDEEEVDPKAGGGNNITIGQMAEEMLVKLEWYGTLFPRIPVPTQKEIERKLKEHRMARSFNKGGKCVGNAGGSRWEEETAYENPNDSRPLYQRQSPPDNTTARIRPPNSDDLRPRNRSRSTEVNRSRGNNKTRSPEQNGSAVRARSRSRNRSIDRRRNEKDLHRSRERSKDRQFNPSRDRSKDRQVDRSRDRSKDRQVVHSRDRSKEKQLNRSRDRSKDKYRDSERKRDKKKEAKESKRSRSKSREHKKSHKKHKRSKNDDYSNNLQKELERIRKTE